MWRVVHQEQGETIVVNLESLNNAFLLAITATCFARTPNGLLLEFSNVAVLLISN